MKFIILYYNMSEYTIGDLSNLVVGHINMASCECKYLVHVGKDLNGNRIMYYPLKHSIKECYKSTPTPKPKYACKQQQGKWNCVIDTHGPFSTIDECKAACPQYSCNNNYQCTEVAAGKYSNQSDCSTQCIECSCPGIVAPGYNCTDFEENCTFYCMKSDQSNIYQYCINSSSSTTNSSKCQPGSFCTIYPLPPTSPPAPPPTSPPAPPPTSPPTPPPTPPCTRYHGSYCSEAAPEKHCSAGSEHAQKEKSCAIGLECRGQDYGKGACHEGIYFHCKCDCENKSEWKPIPGGGGHCCFAGDQVVPGTCRQD